MDGLASKTALFVDAYGQESILSGTSHYAPDRQPVAAEGYHGWTNAYGLDVLDRHHSRVRAERLSGKIASHLEPHGELGDFHDAVLNHFTLEPKSGIHPDDRQIVNQMAMTHDPDMHGRAFSKVISAWSGGDLPYKWNHPDKAEEREVFERFLDRAPKVRAPDSDHFLERGMTLNDAQLAQLVDHIGQPLSTERPFSFTNDADTSKWFSAPEDRDKPYGVILRLRDHATVPFMMLENWPGHALGSGEMSDSFARQMVQGAGRFAKDQGEHILRHHNVLMIEEVTAPQDFSEPDGAGMGDDERIIVYARQLTDG